MALTAQKPRDFVTTYPEQEAVFDVAASTTIYEGALLTVDGSGNAVNATGTTGLLGVAMHSVDNSTGAAGAKTVRVKTRCTIEVSIGDTIAKTDQGGTIEVSDNDTFRLAAAIVGLPVGKIQCVRVAGASGTNRVWLTIVGDCARDL